MTCLHEEIKTWYFEDTNQPAGMWSCKSCGHKFFPLKLWVGLTDEQIYEHEWWDEETAFAVNKELMEKNT